LHVAEPHFVAPSSLKEALEANAALDALALAGGTALAHLVRSRLVEPATLVFLGRIAELQRIERSGPVLRLGSGCTFRQLSRDLAVQEVAPCLGRVAGQIANPRIVSVATLGGALVHADPRQDLQPLLLALGASVLVASPSATREVPVAGFARGLMDVDLAQDELVVEVIVRQRRRRQLAYERFTPEASDDFPTVAVAAGLERSEDATISDATLALGAVGPTAFLVPAVRELIGTIAPDQGVIEAVAEAAAAASRPVADRHGSVAYKQEMVAVHVRRALRRVLGHDASGAA
jgi:carbon-monoxide dehydrogenase medium subunit